MGKMKKSKQKTIKKGNGLIWAVAIVLVAIVFVLSICIGRYQLSPTDVVKTILQDGFGMDFGMKTEAVAIVMKNRLPRALAGALVGAALAVSGCAFQGLFQNPLVSQGILGVSSGAGFGAALAILLFGSTVFAPGLAFVFGILAVVLSLLVARMCGEVTTLMLVLGGTIISSIFSALLSFLKYVADPYNELASIVFWNMGSLASIDSDSFGFAAAAMIAGIVLLMIFGWMINVLSMGDIEAKSMGLNTTAAKIIVVTGASLATAGAVSIAGNIGWVGLIIPHVARFLVGSDNKKLVPFSVICGAGFMITVDMLCRTITGSEIPLGIMTSLIGGPFFIYLLRKYKGGGWK